MHVNPAAALDSLRGLALGDAFGDTWFFRTVDEVERMIGERSAPQGPWLWTDDTAMAVSLFQVLSRRSAVVQDELAMLFATVYDVDPYRKYGPSMHGVLRAIFDGEPWHEVTTRQFEGQGSWGNGAAMRVAPFGVWFSHDLDTVVEQAALSAAVTHAHPEATAGAIAVAVAAALAVQGIPGDELISETEARTPDSEVASRLRRVAGRPFTSDPKWIAGEVGCGLQVSAPDTVPYAIWCAARHVDDLTDVLWATVSAGGDIDTTTAIAAGIVAARTGLQQVPAEWWEACEPLPDQIVTAADDGKD